MPPLSAAMYRVHRSVASELSAQAMPTRMPPTSTTIFGPKRSTSQPSTGTSQVSVSTKMVKATWIAARPQWYFWSIGLTNRVQPYCRLAIITMQMMPKISWPHRVASDAVARDEIASVVLVVTVPSMPRILLVARNRDLGPRPRGLTPRLRRQHFNDARKQLVADWLPPTHLALAHPTLLVAQPSMPANQRTPPRCNASADRVPLFRQITRRPAENQPSGLAGFPDLRPNDRDAMTHPHCALQ